MTDEQEKIKELEYTIGLKDAIIEEAAAVMRYYDRHPQGAKTEFRNRLKKWVRENGAKWTGKT